MENSGNLQTILLVVVLMTITLRRVGTLGEIPSWVSWLCSGLACAACDLRRLPTCGLRCRALSAVKAQGALGFTVAFTLAQRLSLVVQASTLSQSQLHLGYAVGEVQRQRY